MSKVIDAADKPRWSPETTKDLVYKTVNTYPDLEELHNEIKKNKKFACDIECRSIDPYVAKYERPGFPLVSIQL